MNNEKARSGAQGQEGLSERQPAAASNQTAQSFTRVEVTRCICAVITGGIIAEHPECPMHPRCVAR
jgi:hypothetical protein